MIKRVEEIKNKIYISNKKVINENNLDFYIHFCIKNDIGKHIKFKTARHHILPQGVFPEYKEFKYNNWNGVYLSHHNHYYAHWLLTYIFNEPSVYFSFMAMHNKDVKIGRLDYTQLIEKNIYENKRI